METVEFKGAEDSIEQLRDFLKARRQCSSFDDAMALPAPFYASKNVFEWEQRELLRREWLCVGRAEEAPQPGDYFTVSLLDEPLLIVRGDDRKIKVLVNVCRHRGMLVAQGAGHARNFTCPYHGWTYDRGGALVRAPRLVRTEKFDLETCHLPELKSVTWNGFIFVNLDGDASPLKPRLEGLAEKLADYQMDKMHHAAVQEELWRTNWKCLVENFMEGYHLSVLHKDTLHPITPTSLCKKFEGGEGYTGYWSYYPDSVPSREPSLSTLTPQASRYSTLFCVYPTLVATQSSNRSWYMALLPTSENSVMVRRGTSTYKESLTTAELVEYTDLWDRISIEDQDMLERLQKGYSSRNASLGPLVGLDHEGTIWDFHQYLAGCLT